MAVCPKSGQNALLVEFKFGSLLHYIMTYRISGNIGGHYIWQFAHNLAEMDYWRNLNLAVFMLYNYVIAWISSYAILTNIIMVVNFICNCQIAKFKSLPIFLDLRYIILYVRTQ